MKDLNIKKLQNGSYIEIFDKRYRTLCTIQFSEWNLKWIKNQQRIFGGYFRILKDTKISTGWIQRQESWTSVYIGEGVKYK